MTTPAPYLSVVLPCRNQEDHISEVLALYPPSLDTLGRPYEVIVVPNACSDGTQDAVERVAASEPRVRVVPNPAGGWGRSVLTGLAAARGAVLCYANSARTDPIHVVALLALYEANSPCVAKVSREERGAPLREIGSWLYNLEGRVLFGFPTRDVNGTPKILSRTDYLGLGLEAAGDLLDLELVAKAWRLGLRVVELPVRGFRRHGGRSSTRLASAWTMYAGALRLRQSLASDRGAGL